MSLKEWHTVLKRGDTSGCDVVCYPIVTRTYHLPYKPEGHNDENLLDIYDNASRDELISSTHIQTLLRLVKYHANDRLYHTEFDYPIPPEPSNDNDDPGAEPIKIDSYDGNKIKIHLLNDETYWESGDTDITYKTTDDGTKFAWDYENELPNEKDKFSLVESRNPNYVIYEYRADPDKYEDPYISKIVIPDQPGEFTEYIEFSEDDDDDAEDSMYAYNNPEDVEIRGEYLIKLFGTKLGTYELQAFSNQRTDIEYSIDFYITYGDKEDEDDDGNPKIKTDKKTVKFKYNPVITSTYIINASYPDRVKSYLKHLGTLSTLNYGDFNSGDLVRSDDFRNLLEAAIEMSRVCNCVSNYTDDSQNICDCNY